MKKLNAAVLGTLLSLSFLSIAHADELGKDVARLHQDRQEARHDTKEIRHDRQETRRVVSCSKFSGPPWQSVNVCL